jgi:hypothetical protein
MRPWKAITPNRHTCVNSSSINHLLFLLSALVFRVGLRDFVRNNENRWSQLLLQLEFCSSCELNSWKNRQSSCFLVKFLKKSKIIQPSTNQLGIWAEISTKKQQNSSWNSACTWLQLHNVCAGAARKLLSDLRFSAKYCFLLWKVF